uniref:Uncharacterized protein n=1 Tax=Anopheles quadriannulatus TaxID=34691 RepID=A0A182X137_ANOQN
MALAAVADAGLAPLLYGAPLAIAAPHTTVVQSNSDAKLITTAPAYSYAAAPLAYPYAAAGAPLATIGVMYFHETIQNRSTLRSIMNSTSRTNCSHP